MGNVFTAQNLKFKVAFLIVVPWGLLQGPHMDTKVRSGGSSYTIVLCLHITYEHPLILPIRVSNLLASLGLHLIKNGLEPHTRHKHQQNLVHWLISGPAEVGAVLSEFSICWLDVLSLTLLLVFAFLEMADFWAVKKALWARALDTKREDLHFIPGSHMWKKRLNSSKLPSYFQTCAGAGACP